MATLLGVGNEMITADSFGPALAKALAGTGIKALNCSTAPENFLKHVKEADVLLIADSARIPGEEGRVLMLENPSVLAKSGSTHTMPLDRLALFAKGKVYYIVFSPPDGCTKSDINAAVAKAKAMLQPFFR